MRSLIHYNICIQYAAVSLPKKAVLPVNTELVVFIVYLCFMLGIGVYFF